MADQTVTIEPMSIYVFLADFLLAIAILIGALFLVNRRYGSRFTKIILVVVFVFGCMSTQLVNYFYEPDEIYEEYDEEAVYPAVEWRRVLSSEGRPEGFVFESGHGLFLITPTDNVQLTQAVPGCLTDGGVAASYRNSRSTQPIEESSQPEISLPSPPASPLHQVYFDIPIQNVVEVDTVIHGASGYAAYSNGEIWCTERQVQRGQAIGVALGLGAGSNLLARQILALSFSLPLAVAAIVFILEFWRKRTGRRL